MNDTGLKSFVRLILISYWLLLLGLVLLFCFFIRVSDGEMGDTFFMGGVFCSFVILLPFAIWARWVYKGWPVKYAVIQISLLLIPVIIVAAGWLKFIFGIKMF